MEIIKLNLIPSGVNPVCHCSQYDNGRVIRLELFDGLTPYVLQSGDTVTLNVRKPDNTIVTASVTSTQGNNYVDIVTTEQICACVGNNLCDLTIKNGSVIIGTLNFYMQIERDVLADGNESESVIRDLDTIVLQTAREQTLDTMSDIATLEAGTNKINPDKLSLGFIQNDGTLSTASSYVNYKTTDYIKVNEGDNYVFIVYDSSTFNIKNERKGVLFFREDKTPITESYQNTTSYPVLQLQAPTNAAYVRVSTYFIDRVFLFAEGSSAIAYEPYKVYCVLNDTTPLTSKMTEQINNIIDNSGKKMELVKSGNNITLLSNFGTKKLKRYFAYANRANGLFNFVKTSLIDNDDETIIHDTSDTIAPIRLGVNNSDFSIGANHGWSCFKIAKQNLTDVDTGSTWTDGTNTYILAQIKNNYAYFIYPATLSDHKYIYNNTLPATSLTHVSGATHTTTLALTSLAADMLYPSVNRKSISYYVDGEKVEGDINKYCNRFTVKEQYRIIDYSKLGEYLINHIGSSIGDDIRGCVLVNNIYDFTETNCLITTTYEALQDINYYNCGIIQSEALEISGNNKRYFYVNNQNSNSDIKSETLYDATSNTAQINIYSSNAIDNDKATNRIIELITDSNNNGLYGFAQGYLPDVSDGADNYRKTISMQGEFRANTLKSYPVAIYNQNINTGDFKSFCCYKNYYLPSYLTNGSIIYANNATYVIIDAHRVLSNGQILMPIEYIGKEIETIEAYNFVLKSDIIGGEGITFDITNSYGCGILKIRS